MTRRFQLISIAIVLTALVPAATAMAQPREAHAPNLPWTWSLGSYVKRAPITVGQDELSVELADNAALRSRGLSYRDALDEGTGMLFIYDDAGARSFWMKGMRFCLDIVWISGTEIVGAAERVCPEPGVPDAQLTTYASPSPVQYVLEVPAGWLDDHGYGAGTPVDLSALSD